MFFKVTHNSDLYKDQMSKYINEINKNNEYNKTTILNYDSKKESFTDLIIGRNYVLISHKLKIIFAKYKENIINNRVVFIDQKEETQEIYWTLNLPLIECVSDKAILGVDLSIKNLVLIKEKIENESMFLVSMVKNSSSIYAKKVLILNLSVCESLLRRNVIGLNYEMVETD